MSYQGQATLPFSTGYDYSAVAVSDSSKDNKNRGDNKQKNHGYPLRH
jgi:hypothetical protein